MTPGPPGGAPAAVPRWLPGSLLALLILPMQPFWLDFEQVRRGLLLLLVGATLVSFPRLPPLRQWPLAALLLWLLASAAVQGASLNLWEAGYRLAYYAALLQLLRLSAATGARRWLRPAAVLLLLTAAFGLLQRLGLAELSGYGTIAEPVSLFGNANVAAEVTAVLLAASGVLALERSRLALAALVLGGAYLAVTGARAALWLALPAAVGWLLLASPGRGGGKARLGLAVAAGLLGGFLLEGAAPAVQRPAPAAAARPFVERRPSASLEVRLDIAASCLAMLRDAPLAGVGPGQFALQYPRYRSEREIERSSYGRQFPTEVRAAHDDWLEMAVEGGVPALLLLLAGALRLLRAGAQDRARLAPLLALGVAMLARAPLQNAPAAALALLVAAPPPAAATAPRQLARWLAPLLARTGGLALLALGLSPLLANVRFAAYQGARAVDAATGVATPAFAALADAAALAPYEPRFRQLLAQEYQASARDARGLEPALAAADAAVALRPHEPSYRLLRADLLRQAGRFAAAHDDLRAAAAVDAGDPQLQLQLAGLAFTEGDHETAIAALCLDPHPRLRQQLGEKFDDFARLCRSRGDEAAERRYFAEACLVRALDALPARDRRAHAVAEERLAIARGACRNAGLDGRDARLPALTALLALDRGDAQRADAEASAAVAAGPLAAWQRSLLAPHLDRLRALPAWRAYLAP